MFINQIADDLYLVIGETYHSNSTAFVSQDQVLLVDALGSRTDAEKLKEFVEGELKKEVRFIVCTHFFSDHLAALNFFPSATVIAHKNYLNTFSSELYRTEEEAQHFREPDILVSDEMQIRWGRHTLHMFHSPGHTTSTLAIDVKEANLLMVGDNLVGNIVYLAYSTPDRITSALEGLQRRRRERVISSHGNVRSSAAIGNAQFYLESLRDLSSRVGGQRVLEIELETCVPDGVEATPFEKIFHERNLRTIVERGFFAPATASSSYHL